MPDIERLELADLRGDLIRQEESIIFALIERAQFKLNPPIYTPGAIPLPGFDGCFADFLLAGLEQAYARVRRYTSPDEHPFTPDLPPPVLPAMAYAQRIKPNRINVNDRIKTVYRTAILPAICAPGECGNFGSSATCDANCLQALSKRIHYGKFIAEAKFQAAPDRYAPLIRADDVAGMMAALTDPAVEARLLARVRRKGAAYGQDIDDDVPSDRYKIAPESIARIYEQWLIPLTKEVEILYLQQRLDD